MFHILEVLDFQTFKITRFIYSDKKQAEEHIARLWGNPSFGLSINHVAL